MAAKPHYSDTLRAIAQSLEVQEIEAFELVAGEREVLVRGQIRAARAKSGSLARWLGRRKEEPESLIELRYSTDDIRRLQELGRERRQNPGQTPDYFALSQILRTVGVYIDHTDFKFRRLRRTGPRLELYFEESDGEIRIEEHLVSSFHNYFLQMYMRRSKES